MLRAFPPRGQLGGRLKHHFHEWTQLFPPREVLEWVVGVQIPFCRVLPPPWPCREYHLDREMSEGIQQQLQEYMELGALRPARQGERIYSSPIFGRPKPDKTVRVITDLTKLNEFVGKQKFRMEGLREATLLMTPGVYMTKIDIKSAFFHLPVHPAHQRFLGIQWQGETLVFTSLPFGLTICPRVFSKTMGAVMRYLRGMGVRSVFYIDDILIFGETQNQCAKNTQATVRTLLQLGFEVSWKKCTLTPTQRIEFLGFILDSLRMTVGVAEEKMREARFLVRDALKRQTLSCRQLAKVVGKVVALRPAILGVLLRTVFLEKQKEDTLQRNGGNWDATMTLSQESTQDLQWFLTIENPEVPVRPPQPTWVVETDACEQGWGATVTNKTLQYTFRCHETWTEEDVRVDSVNVLELLGGKRTFETCPEIRDTAVLWKTDNSTVRWDCTKWKSTSLEMNPVLRELLDMIQQRHIQLTVIHIPGKTNIVPDRLSRWVDANDYQLHPRIFREVQRQTPWELTVDGMASARNKLLPRFWSLVREPGAAGVNFFVQDLAQEIPWINPPFNLVFKTLMHIKEQGARALVVLPQWETKAWWPLALEMTAGRPIQLPLLEDTFRPGTLRNLRGVGKPQWRVSVHHIVANPQERKELDRLLRAGRGHGPASGPHARNPDA